MNKKREEGFTLLEILAVIAIIGILATFITPKVADSVNKARDSVCDANIKYLEGVLEQYRLAKGDFPADNESLLEWYNHEFSVCPKQEDELGEIDTGYYFNKDSGKVSITETSWVKLLNSE